MKLKRLAAAVTAAVITTSLTGLSALAAENSGYEKRTVTAFRYDEDDSRQLTCLFTDGLPELPYVSIEDYLESIFDAEFSAEDKGSGVYEITGNGGVITVDTVSDRAELAGYEEMTVNNVIADEDDKNEFIAHTFKTDGGAAELDFSGYGIDLIADDGQVYFPLTTLSDLFGITYNAGTYVDGKIYFQHTSDIMRGFSYYDNSSVFESVERSQAMADHSYNELCFLMDNIYAAPGRAALAESITEKGFDKTLDEYSDATRAAKEHLRSGSWAEYLYGLFMLGDLLDDGGHTMLSAFTINEGYTYPDSALMTAYRKLTSANDPLAMDAHKWLLDMMFEDRKTDFQDARETAYPDSMELIELWEDEEAALFADEDTAVFVFDSFSSDVLAPFKKSADYAAEQGIKNFIIDLSANSGGDSDVVWYMMALMNSRNSGSNQISYYMNCALTGNNVLCTEDLDLDLNGVIDEKDKDVKYDFRFGILASRASFSCGNLMPCLAQDIGIPVLGETSGGGGSMLGIYYYPDGTYGTLSSGYTMLRGDLTDVDGGVTVDYQLPSDDDDKSAFYDLAAIKQAMDDFYGTVDDSEPDSQSQSEPDSRPESEPDGGSSGSEGSAPSGSGTSNPATGTVTSLSLSAAAAAALILIRRKNR